MDRIGKSIGNSKVLKVVDASGINCPQPLILTKRALEEVTKEGVEGILQVIVSNEAAKINVSKFAASQGYEADADGSGESFLLSIHVRGNDAGTTVSGNAEEKEDVGRITSEGELCYLITRNVMGGGSEELGAILMRPLFYTFLETQPRPQKIFFVNSGIFLALDDSSVLKYLEELARQNVEVFVCGTCLDFYNAKERLSVGEVTNMYTIAESLNNPQNRVVTI